MPAVYSSVQTWLQTAEASAYAAFIGNLADGTLDRYLLSASAHADQVTRRKLGAPPSGVAVKANVSAGANNVSIANVAGIYQTDVCVFARTGEAQEIISADVTSFDPSYVGEYPQYTGQLVFAGTLSSSYTTSDTVTIYRQDRYQVKGKPDQPIDSTPGMSQRGELAQMHAPKGFGVGSARRIFLNEYPITSVYKAFESLPWSNTETTADLSAAYIDGPAGWLRLPVGYFNPQSTYWRVQYAAGFPVLPRDIRDAVHLHMSYTVSRVMNPMGANEIKSDGQLARLTQNSPTAGQPPSRPLAMSEFEAILRPYARKGR
jgi:hypothetical protein